MALDGDNAQSLLSRADAALYSGKAAGRNRIFRHTGSDIEPVAWKTAEAVEVAS
jgi:hypothetical protein